jgi:protein-tyrosine phosphatase
VTPPLRILFVCIGNICRSPTAEAVFRTQVEKAGWSKLFTVDSAGTTGWHVGEPPDKRAQKHAAARGYNLAALRARKISSVDFDNFDLILTMEKPVLDDVQKLKKSGEKDGANGGAKGCAEVAMFLDYLPGYEGQDVPDPYYGNADGFDAVLDLVEEGSDALLRAMLKKKGVLSCGC